MPIKIPNGLPAAATLRAENIFVMPQDRALTQDIRPLRIGIVNLMPTKIATETQLSRLLGNTPLQVELEFIQTSTYAATHTAEEHMLAFYTTFEQIADSTYDGLIITGAPVELLEFEEVDYWDELCQIMDWSLTHVQSTFHICWGAQAGLYHHYGIGKHQLDHKLFGIFEHRVEVPDSRLLRGFDDVFMAPHSRHTTIERADVEAVPQLRVLAASEQAGVYAIVSRNGRQVFITGHSEYDPETLRTEYLRDRDLGLPIDVPAHYFPDDDPARSPQVSWRAHANLLYSNWLNYFVYQSTPYDLTQIPVAAALATDPD